MPTSEKEINCNLFDQLSLLEDIEEVATEKAVLEIIAKKRKQIERKLYQQPPLIKE